MEYWLDPQIWTLMQILTNPFELIFDLFTYIIICWTSPLPGQHLKLIHEDHKRYPVLGFVLRSLPGLGTW